MRAVTYSCFGPADEVLSLEDLATPDPAAGEVLVRLMTSGVNPSDVRARAGGRPGVTAPPFPKIIPHSDGAGLVEAVGEGVDMVRVGQRVWIWNGAWQRAFGTAAEFIALPAEQVVPLPDNTSFETGAILGIPGLTACHTVLGGGPVDGKTLLVSGGGGTVGNLAIQIAAASGAKVVSTVSAKDVEAAKAAGAAHVFDYQADDLAERILEANDGHPVDRIVEVEFGKNVQTNTKVIAERGTICAYGSAKDMTPALPFYPLMFKAVKLDLALIYLLSAAERSAAVSKLMEFLEQEVLSFRIDTALPLEQCAKAHDLIASGSRSGSVILTI